MATATERRPSAISSFLSSGSPTVVVPRTRDRERQFKTWLEKFESLFQVTQRLGNCYELERPSLMELHQTALRELAKSTDNSHLSVMAVLEYLFRKLDRKAFGERDPRHLPYLFPIRIDRSSEKVVARYYWDFDGSRTLVFRADLFLPPDWPFVLKREYADLAKGLMTFSDEQESKARKDKQALPEVKFEVAFKSVIPLAAHKDIARAISLVGSENVFVVVDCTGVDPKQRLEIVPLTDPVVVAICRNQIFHVTDFDTTAAESELAITTTEDSFSFETPQH